jgi:hypothetical protein
MRSAVFTLVKVLIGLAWLGVIATFLVYNFFIQAGGLHQPPCKANSHVILWRSTHFCATGREARLWELNYHSMYVLLGLAVALPMIAGAYDQVRRKLGSA